jgi:hypothetical protein
MPVEYLPHQQQRRVETIPTFNGANCLVCVDVPAIVSRESSAWGSRYLRDRTTPALTDADLSGAILAALDAEISQKCPTGAVKVQFLFHYGGAYIDSRPFPTKRYVSYVALLQQVLQQLAARAGNRITKFYLAGCSSHEYTQLVDAAFSGPGVTHVVTVDSTIALSCGSIEGLGWDEKLNQPTFQPDSVRVIVWVREGGKQIAQVPDREVKPSERFNVVSNTIEPKSVPATGPCPTRDPLSGSHSRRVGYYNTAAAALAAATAIVQQDAVVEARFASNKFRCPNPGCQKKSVGPITTVVRNVYATRTTLGALVASLFSLSWKYEGVVDYDWTSSVICE